MIALAEVRHDTRFKKLAANIENGKVFKKEAKTLWNAAIAVMFTKAGKRPKSVRPAFIPRNISRSLLSPIDLNWRKKPLFSSTRWL
jgi:hypothetical protein